MLSRGGRCRRWHWRLACAHVSRVLAVVRVVHLFDWVEDFLSESVQLALGLVLIVLDAIAVGIDNVAALQCVRLC